MKRTPADRRIARRDTVRALVVFTAAVLVALTLIAQSQAHTLITNPQATRQLSTVTPAAYQMEFEDVSVRTRDGLRLVGWYVRGSNGAMVMLQATRNSSGSTPRSATSSSSRNIPRSSSAASSGSTTSTCLENSVCPLPF